MMFLSDNGGPTHELTSSNAPLRGGKGQLYEGGIRAPMLVQWKGNIASTQPSNVPVIATDIAATALSAAGAAAPKDKPLDGIDLLPLMTKKTAPAPRDFYWRMGKKIAYRSMSSRAPARSWTR